MTTGSAIQSVDALGTELELELHELGSTGSTVLLLHGGADLPPDAPFVAALAEDHRVLLPSHPGFGRSDRPDWLERVEDIAHFYLELLEQRGLHDVVVVGCSLGGWIAAEMATWRPQRMSGLVLVDPVGIRVGGPTDRDIADIFVLSPDQRDQLLFHDPANAGPPATELGEEELMRRMRNEESTALFGWEPYFCNPRLRRRLAAVPIPALVVWGSDDRLVTPDYGRAYAESFSDATFELIDAAGHLPHVEQPSATASTVREFLATRGLDEAPN